MSDEIATATLRCDRCDKRVEINLEADRTAYIRMVELGYFDAAQEIARWHAPSGWRTEMGDVQRDSLRFEWRTGKMTTESQVMRGVLDFCPDCPIGEER